MLWVQGVQPSGKMRDVELRVDPKGVPPPVPRRGDAVKFTVLWVGFLDVKFSGQVEDNNTARATYMNLMDNHMDNLGFQNYTRGTSSRVGWSFESYGFVYPSDFNYPGANLHLDRDAQWRWYAGAQVQRPAVNFNARIPPGNDTSNPALRDDDPVASQGMIFDLDSPWMTRWVRRQNIIQRGRWDFREFADVMSQGQLVRFGGRPILCPLFNHPADFAPGHELGAARPARRTRRHQTGSWYGDPPPVTWNLQ
jgi:hypothetical protein